MRAILEGRDNIVIVGEASNGEEAVENVELLRPEVVVLGINMPKKNGIDATAEIKTLYPATVIIGLSVNPGGENEAAMVGAGAALLLGKEAAVEHLYDAIVKAIGVSSNEHVRG